MDPKSDELTRRVVYLQKLIDTFWDSWSNEYLLQLRESRRKNTHDSSSGRLMLEMVAVHDENQRGGSCKLGKVERLLVGEDKKTRSEFTAKKWKVKR